jgi:CO dehydrogenase maturation factor
MRLFGKGEIVLILTAGKGGTGKTTWLCGLARYLQARGLEFVVVDGDPVGGIGQLLEAPERPSISDVGVEDPERVLEEALAPLPGGGVHARVGHHFTPGCYCRNNTFLRACLARLLQRYSLVLVDAEAGPEHVSRGTALHVSRLLLVADQSAASLRAAAGILELARELGRFRGRAAAHLLVRGESFTSPVEEAIDGNARSLGLPRPRYVLNHPEIAAAQLAGRPMPPYSTTSAFYRQVARFARRDLRIENSLPDSVDHESHEWTNDTN